TEQIYPTPNSPDKPTPSESGKRVHISCPKVRVFTRPRLRLVRFDYFVHLSVG
ncbi:hypothetical protein PanWU01x14_241460, partial [Parasponia andersonii]